MNYQEKLALIDEGKDALAAGMAWEAWEARLTASGLYQNDINTNGIKVISAVDETYGDAIQEEMMATGTAIKPENLHDSVFEKIVERRKKQVQAKLSRIISQQILDGGEPEVVLAQNAHPLLDGSVLRSAIRKTNAEAEVRQEKAENASPLSLILGLVFLFGGLGLTMASSGGTIFYGAIIVGLVMIVKYIAAAAG
ncbi:MAG: hypothetical protein AB8H12_01755 [Lewinella sp.]